MNVWVAIFSYIGNYYWTHYFFNLLGAAYTFPSYLLNGVGVEHGWLPSIKHINEYMFISCMPP